MKTLEDTVEEAVEEVYKLDRIIKRVEGKTEITDVEAAPWESRSVRNRKDTMTTVSDEAYSNPTTEGGRDAVKELDDIYNKSPWYSARLEAGRIFRVHGVITSGELSTNIDSWLKRLENMELTKEGYDHSRADLDYIYRKSIERNHSGSKETDPLSPTQRKEVERILDYSWAKRIWYKHGCCLGCLGATLALGGVGYGVYSFFLK